MQLYRDGNYVLWFDGQVNRHGLGSFCVLGKMFGNKFVKFYKNQTVERRKRDLQPFYLPDALLSNDFKGCCKSCGLPIGQQTQGVKCPGCGELYSFGEWVHSIFADCITNI